MAGLSNTAEIRNELRAACSQKVNEMLFNFVGPDPLQTASENDLLGFIKSVAVKTVHPEVYRQHFYNLKQSDSETITSFISRLKAQAMLCAFQCKGTCGNDTCTPSYAEEMIRSQLIAGLRNSSHQSKVLSEMEVLKTLDQLTTRLLTLEATERASSEFQSPHQTTSVSDVTAVKYSTKSTKPPFKHPTNKPCAGCGKQFHPKGRSTCPAWGKVCKNCNKINHFANVCRSSKVALTAANQEESDDLLMSSINSISPLWLDGLPHGDLVDNNFVPKKPEAPPILDISIKINKKAYRNLRPNEHWSDSPNDINVKAVADTGAQICTAGSHILESITQSITKMAPAYKKPSPRSRQ